MGTTTGGQGDTESREMQVQWAASGARLSLKMLVPSLSGNLWGHCRRDSTDGKGSGMRGPLGSFWHWDRTTMSRRENLCWPSALSLCASQAHPTAAWPAVWSSPLWQTGVPTASECLGLTWDSKSCLLHHIRPKKWRTFKTPPQRLDRLPISSGLWS